VGTADEIRQAMVDFQSGRFGEIADFLGAEARGWHPAQQ